MAPILPPRTPVGVVLLAWRLWRILPPTRRRQVLRLAIAVGPRALLAVRSARSRRRL